MKKKATSFLIFASTSTLCSISTIPCSHSFNEGFCSYGLLSDIPRWFEWSVTLFRMPNPFPFQFRISLPVRSCLPALLLPCPFAHLNLSIFVFKSVVSVHLFFAANWHCSIYLAIGYVILINVLQKFMENRKPYRWELIFEEMIGEKLICIPFR